MEIIYHVQYHLLYSTLLSFSKTVTWDNFERKKQEQIYFDFHSFTHKGHIKIGVKNLTVAWVFSPSYLPQLGKHCANEAVGKKSIFA